MLRGTRLSAAKVRTLDIPGRHADGNGLYLQVRLSKRGLTKSWVLRYMRHGRAHTMGLGPLSAVSLAEARLAAADAQKLLHHGTDPLEAKRKAVAHSSAPTFTAAAKTYIQTHRSSWKNEKHAGQWTSSLAHHAEPVIGNRRVDQIDRSDVLRVIEPIWLTKSETATRVRGRIEKILDWATAEGFRTGENPARWRGNLEHSLPKRPVAQRTRHLAAMPWQDLPAFYERLTTHDGMAAVALRFTILTAARTSEVRFATEAEFELRTADGLWTIPKERMKAGKEHRVPLTVSATTLVNAALGNQTYVFSPFPDKALSENAMLALLKRMNVTGVTVHGFRSSFRDWAAETTTTQREVIEACLAHSNPDQVEAAYLRSDVLEKRRSLMREWAQFVIG